MLIEEVGERVYTFGRNEVMEEWWKLRNEEHHNVYP
jgi:hypothetical protein